MKKRSIIVVATSIDFLSDAPRMLRDLLLIRWNEFRGRYAAARGPHGGGGG